MNIMKRVPGQRMTSACCLVFLSATVACQKKSDPPAPVATITSPPPAVSIAPLAEAVAATTSDAAAATATATLGLVKRFPEKEQALTGAVKVTIDNSPVFDEPDATKPTVASLSKDLFVFRLATLGADWLLVDFPSGLGKLAPGWIEAKSVGAEVHSAVTHATVASQPKTAILAGSEKPAAPSPAAPAKVATPSITTAPAVTPAPVLAKVVTPPVATTPATATVRVRPSLIAPPMH